MVGEGGCDRCHIATVTENGTQVCISESLANEDCKLQWRRKIIRHGGEGGWGGRRSSLDYMHFLS